MFPQNSLICSGYQVSRHPINDVDLLVSVQVSDRLAGQLLQLCDAGHADNLLPVLRRPERYWSAPVAVTTYGPVPRISQPVAEPPLLHKIRHPAAKQDFNKLGF